MRRLLVPAATLVVALVLVSSASAAVRIASRSCNRFSIGSGQAGSSWVPVLGSGVFPNERLRLAWSDRSLASYTTSGPTGAFGLRTLMPNSFIRSRGPHVATYRLNAFDDNNGAKLGSGRVNFVRFDAGFASRRRPHQVTSYGLWGAPAGRKVWMHFFFGGRQRRLVYMGRANHPCGIVHRRMQVLPTRSRYGLWKVYLTNSKTLTGRGIRRRRFIVRLEFTVYKIYVPAFRAAAAALAP